MSSTACALVVAAVVGLLVIPARSGADSDERPPATRPPSRESPDDQGRLPAVLSDTSITLRLRMHYVNVDTVTGIEREAWAYGGWLAYRSGWLANALQIGATVYASMPLHAPQDKAETLLLAPGREGYYVLGEAFAAVGHRKYATLKAYRQALEEPYINRQDNAMTPNTFEAVTVGGKARAFEYLAGYAAGIKTRNADEFVPMSQAAGGRGTDRGVAMLRVKVEPPHGLEVTVSEQYGLDTYNTLFVRVEADRHLEPGVRLQIGAQLTDQRAVGDALAATTRVQKWDTQNGSTRVALTFGDLTLTAAASVTASGNKIQSPWGFFPGYMRMDQQQFNNANEKAWLVGLDYDFKAVIPGLVALAKAGWGIDSIDPVTRASMPDEAEYDLVVAYRPPAIKRLLLRTRGLLYHQDGAARLGSTFRFTINWEIPLLGTAAQPPR